MVLKCKMCGGQLAFREGETVCTCEYCGTEQTIPRLESERKAGLYDRANHLRRNNEFDKAEEIYEQILNEDPTDSEAYWGLVLCRYGVEYVEDTQNNKRVPTINRMQPISVYADGNYKSAIQYADMRQKKVYEEEAGVIDEIQKKIRVISEQEEPYDVFICYKEADDMGRRAPDSVLANDLYHQLEQENLRVFFARITLEDKIGQEYEPYIYSALMSAKVMVVLGTKPEYFKAVWVKNEWSRYLALIKNGEKKVLIPAYKDMDPYDLPEEFSNLQAMDMSKLGFMQDLLRGIEKIVNNDKEKKDEDSSDSRKNEIDIATLKKRGYMAMEDGEWEKADEFFESILNQDAENGDAFLGKLLVKKRCSNMKALESFYKKKYEAQGDPVVVEACPEVTEHIEQQMRERMVPEYLTAAMIKKEYQYDRSYVTKLPGYIKKKQLLEEELVNDNLIKRCRQYLNDAEKEELNQIFSQVMEALEKEIQIIEKEDQVTKAKIEEGYAKFLVQADNLIEQKYDDLVEQKYKKKIKWEDVRTVVGILLFVLVISIIIIGLIALSL